MLVRYEGVLGIDHEYLDVPDTVLSAVEDFLKRAYASRGFVRVAEDDKSFKLEMDRWSTFQSRANNNGEHAEFAKGADLQHFTRRWKWAYFEKL